MRFLIQIKKLLKKILPKKMFDGIHHFARHQVRPLVVRKARIELKYLKIFTSKYGLRVIGGPFEGMEYVDRSIGSVLLLKLVGCYEDVLHPIINKIISEKRIETIIDIGCAEGYYLVGLGIKLPQAKLIGYDIEKDSLSLTRDMLRKNKVQNEVKLETVCTAESINLDITNNTLIICDAEGFEKIIIDPENSPKLLDVSLMIIETHDNVDSNITETLTKRFENTHHISKLNYNNSEYSTYKFLSEVENQDHLQLLIIERGIPNQTVLIMSKK